MHNSQIRSQDYKVARTIKGGRGGGGGGGGGGTVFKVE